MKKFLKVLLIIILVVMVLFQLYPKPLKNYAATLSANDISNKYPLPAEVASLLKTSCYDCHSNNTFYPWYSKIQPVSMWLGNHITKGKREINFSEFLSYPLAKQYRKLEEVGEQIEQGEMPPSSYTIIHRNAILTPAQKTTLVNWSKALMDTLKANYPADSIIMLKRK